MDGVRLSCWIMGLLAVSCGARGTGAVPDCAATASAGGTGAGGAGAGARGGALQFPIKRAGACLVDAGGAPVWLHGEAAWSLIVGLDDAELDRYLADRRARGFNALVVNLIEHKYAARAPANRAGAAPFTVPGDFATPNEAYFAHADRVVARAAAAGMAVLLAPAYLGYDGEDEGWYAEIRRSGAAKLAGYGRFVGARYRSAPNVIWLEGGDAPPMKAGDEIEALVAAIRETDSVHIHAAHSTRYRSALDDYDRPWLDLNTTYSDCEGHGRTLRRDATRKRSVPTLFIEGTYEGEKASLTCTISQAYRSLLAGAAGHMFGNRPIWLFDPGWPAALDSPGSRAMQHLAKLITARDLHAVTPDFTGTFASGDDVDVARSRSGATLAFIDAGPRTVHIAAAAGAPGTAGTRRATWFYTVNAKTIDAGRHDAATAFDLTSPPGGPWLLIVEHAAPAAARSAPK